MIEQTFGPAIRQDDPNWRTHTFLPVYKEYNYRQWEERNYPKKPWVDTICRNPSHKFPSHLCIPAGQSHTHTCPGCGESITVCNPLMY